MSEEHVPIVLELAPLPREQIGPFLLLGLPKDADREQIEAHWAARVKAARRNQIKVPLEDINWAREIINDPDRRRRAEASTLNLDTADSRLRNLADAYGVGAQPGPSWQPCDQEKVLADYTPAVPVPEIAAVLPSIPVGEVPLELPAVAKILETFLPHGLDPWTINLESDQP